MNEGVLTPALPMPSEVLDRLRGSQAFQKFSSLSILGGRECEDYERLVSRHGVEMKLYLVICSRCTSHSLGSISYRLVRARLLLHYS